MRKLSLALAVALVGCAADSDQEMMEDPVAPEEEEIGAIDPSKGRTCDGAEARLGTGAVGFEPVSDGDTVYLYRGPQGGYMIYFAVQARGLNPGGVLLQYEERFAGSGEVFGRGEWTIKLRTDIGDGWFERNGVWGEVDESYFTRPLAIRGEEVEVDVTLTDLDHCQIKGLGWRVMVAEEAPM